MFNFFFLKRNPARIVSTFLLFLIIVIGFILRMEGIKFDLPFFYHPDEPFVNNKAIFVAQDIKSNPYSLIKYIWD